MDDSSNKAGTRCQVGDRSTSDVVVRLRTKDGRDEWLYCHSHILTQQSKYFADRLSEKWPTCQILDSRNCVEVFCLESNFDHHVNLLRLLYVIMDIPADDLWNDVRTVLGILGVAFELECKNIISACVNYLEAVPWEEDEEEEILKVIPHMGPEAKPILARLQPVNPFLVRQIFLSALRLATSSPFSNMHDLKPSAQEQIEYMLTDDDDAPLLMADAELKLEVNDCVKSLLKYFNNLIEIVLDPLHSDGKERNMQVLVFCLTDLSWACRILKKLETMKEFVSNWIDASNKIVKMVEQASVASEVIDTRIGIIEVVAKVLEAIKHGSVILPTPKRVHMVKVWLPFVRTTKSLIDSLANNGVDDLKLKIDADVWELLESAFVSVILALPSGEQAEIITEWLQNQHVIRYPDLTEAFEVWCYRSKVAKRRLSLVGDNHGAAATS
ncbi:BTB/POZ domain-containing protein At3g05675 isoform X1 [Momordica charantia]|uniref:BTB/POZ domain-containing protein At3g05675 isoform X1 n=1 Tax=Momordica charantia TaxID=3673 RepID=A0A6J1DSK7_MOMCH|nr:BTB/POZ domain-containing protein At3g05675 isoform X1 [Momordica charantia]XP_022156179.1 BTB/POZ domain-containing protein At3g05675 isoform X1 [Momordica charantia]XP_022156180.1 BTB/POZ domain-containing protein At3g05675 isoform X1 [Momordica charantia]XP_022156181.1 BTB/POZ domain-containing protein At3g05675 isoform X1 [Momordica charantia]XP_022156182.1 BTB/POZ domain-containing protein At3g05675 isoform X1 [Momordica charantia]